LQCISSYPRNGGTHDQDSDVLQIAYRDPLQTAVVAGLQQAMRAVVTSGTGTGANLPGTPVYGKTTFDAKSRPGRSTAVCLGVDGLRSRPVRQRDV